MLHLCIGYVYYQLIFSWDSINFFTEQIEEAVEEGIEEAEKIIEEEIKDEGSGSTEVEDEIFGGEQNEKSNSISIDEKKKNQEKLSQDIINIINDNDEPSEDIDLGSVQEV